ncbi:MAG: T9SS type A sorting domain-containing protein [Flavobacteriales bacterium]|nr:T9SS type A sorting domain-containing protein [Flavobacteriales bacterium]
MKKILLSVLTLTTLGLSAQITDLPFSASISSISIGDSTQIITSGSDKGVNYYFLNNNNGDTVSGPILGTGSNLIFNTGALYTTTNYGVFAENHHLLSLITNNDYINLGSNNRNISTTVSVAAWIKTTTAGLRNVVIDYASSSDAGYILRIGSSGYAEISGRDQSGTYKTSGSSTTFVRDGQWHYLVGTANVNTGVWKIYVDGALENTANLTAGTSMDNTSSLYIGHTFSSSDAFVGDLRDITIWNSELTASDISNNMNLCLTGSESNIVGHFKLNEGTGTFINDHSSLGLNGSCQFYSTNPYWQSTITACSDSLTLTQTATVTVSSVINNLTVVSSVSSVSSGGTAQITVANSQKHVRYFLRDNSNNSIIAGPTPGTGNDIIFNTGVISNTTTYNVLGSTSTSVSFSNNPDHINFTTDNRDISTTLSVAAWIKTTHTGLRNIVLDYGGNNGDAGYILRITSSGYAEISGRDQSGTFKTSGSSTTYIRDGQWHYIVGTANVNTGVWKIYVDGTLENTANLTTGVSMANTQPLYLGSTFSSSSAFLGDLRDVTIWNSELNASDITTNMNTCLTGSELNIVGHFKLNENFGSTIADYSKSSRNGIANFNIVWSDDNLNCRDSLQMTQTATISVSTVGISELDNNLNLNVYPNPTTGKVTFSTTDISAPLNDLVIEIYNLTGQKVTTFNNTNTIDISNLTNGVYFAKIITATNNSIMQKIIKE